MNAQELEWNDLYIVLAVCRHGTLSGAARELGINHSTVFRRINGIEDKIGVRLFERLPTGYVMTEAGEAMQVTAKRLESEIFSLSRKLLGGDLRLSGTLRVTAPDALAVQILMPHFASFCSSYPQIQFELTIENSFLDLSQRETDVAIRSTTSPPDITIGHRLCSLGATIYSSTSYLDKHHELNLETYNWLMPSKDQAWFFANQWLAQNYPNTTVGFRSNTLLALFAAAKQGLGIAPLPFFLGDPETDLQRIIEPPKEFNSELWLLIHPDLKHTARVRAFVEFMSEAILQEKACIEGEH